MGVLQYMIYFYSRFFCIFADPNEPGVTMVSREGRRYSSISEIVPARDRLLVGDPALLARHNIFLFTVLLYFCRPQ